MTTLEEIKGTVDPATGLSGQLATIDGLHVYDHLPGTADFPAACVRLPAIPSYRGDLDLGYFTAMFDIMLMGPSAIFRLQNDLYPFVERTGPKSILEAIEKNRSLGYPDVDAHLVGATPEGLQEIGGVSVFVYSLTVSVNLGGD